MNRALLGLAVAGAVGCQGTDRPVSGGLLFSVTGAGVTGTVPSPCEIDVDFGVVPLGQVSTATIEVQNRTTRTVTFGASSFQLSVALNPTSPSPLAAGSSTQFLLSFAPAQSGEQLWSVNIPTDLPDSVCGSSSPVILVKVSGQAVEPSLTVAPAALDLGTVVLNESAVGTAMLTNRSSVSATGLTAQVKGTDASFFTVGAVPATLAAGASAAVQITYSPVALESKSTATVTFSGAGGESATLSVSGRPVENALSLAPDPVWFGYVELGTNAIGCTTISNAASIAVAIEGITSFETDGVFALSTTLPVEIPAHGSAEVCFTFTPINALQSTGQVTLMTNDPSGDNPVVQLTGWGGGPQISCAPTSLDFGSIEAFTSKTLPVICTNTGTAVSDGNLLLEPPTASPSIFEAQFDQTTDPYPLNGLVPAESAQIDVSYHPTSTTAANGSIVIRNTGGQAQPVVIPVSGQGLPLGQCQLQVSPTTLSFGNIPVGETSEAIAVEIRNVGVDICVLNRVALEHDASSSFLFASGVRTGGYGLNPLVIPPTDAVAPDAAISMTFAPTNRGTFSADLVLSVLNPDGPTATIKLAGTGE